MRSLQHEQKAWSSGSDESYLPLYKLPCKRVCDPVVTKNRSCKASQAEDSRFESTLKKKMSQAQEEEIRQLHERLKVVQAEKATESARAAALQVALFEASMKTRQVLDACKRDAVEVAVEEAVKHHYMARAEMDELVGNIAQDRTKLLSVQGSLLDLQARATKYLQF